MLWEKSSARKSNSKNQIQKLFHFCWSFCPPGSGSGSRDPVGSGSRDPIDSGSSPDLQNWTQRYLWATASNCYQTVLRIRDILVWIRFWDPDTYHLSLFSSCFQYEEVTKLQKQKSRFFLIFCLIMEGFETIQRLTDPGGPKTSRSAGSGSQIPIRNNGSHYVIFFGNLEEYHKNG